MISITFEELETLKLDAMFQDPKPLGSGGKDFLKFLAIYSPGRNLGNVTWTIPKNFCSAS